MLQHGQMQKESSAHIVAADLGNLEVLKLLVEADPGIDLEHAEPWQGSASKNEGVDVAQCYTELH